MFAWYYNFKLKYTLLDAETQKLQISSLLRDTKEKMN